MTEDLTLRDVIAVKRLASHTYTGNLSRDFLHDGVANAGYIASCLLEVSREHFLTTLASHHQPRPMTVQLTFLNASRPGPVVFEVIDSEFGVKTSVVNITMRLYHGPPPVTSADALDPAKLGREVATANVTHARLSSFRQHAQKEGSGVTEPGLLSLGAVKGGSEWQPLSCIPSPEKFEVFLKSSSAGDNGAIDHLVYLHDQPFTTPLLGIAADLWFPTLTSSRKDDSKVPRGLTAKGLLPSQPRPVSLNLEIKKSLPEDEVEFLHVHTDCQKINDGRLDASVVITDASGDVVATCSQIVLDRPLTRSIGLDDMMARL